MNATACAVIRMLGAAALAAPPAGPATRPATQPASRPETPPPFRVTDSEGRPVRMAEAIDAAIYQVTSGRPAGRANAYWVLRDMHAMARDAVQKALASDELDREARQRLEHLAELAAAPRGGIVWWGWAGDGPPQLQPGDVLTSLDGRAVSSLADLDRLPADQMHEGTVWRPGRGEATVTLAYGGIAGGFGFRDGGYPGYVRYGVKGPWDAHVREAYRLVMNYDADCLTYFGKAWEAGCRDAGVLATWLVQLRKLGRLQEAAPLLEVGSDPLTGARPGGEFRYGLVPFQQAMALHQMGKWPEARKLAEQAAAAAHAAGAWRGEPLALAARMLVGRYGPLSPQREIWRLHGDLLMAEPTTRIALAAALVEQLAAEDDFEAALQVAESLPEMSTGKLLADYCRQQAALMKQAEDQPPREHPVLVGLCDDPFPLRPPPGQSCRTPSLAELPANGGFECEVRTVERPRPLAADNQIGIILRNTDEPAYVTIVGTGQLIFQNPTRPGPLYSACRNTSAFPPDEWQRVGLFCDGRRLTATLNGRRVWKSYWTPGKPALYPRCECLQCHVELRNVRFYVLSATPVDNAAVEALLRQRAAAVAGGDLEAAGRAHEAIGRILAACPDAAAAVARMDRQMQCFRRLCSKDGLDLCADEALETAYPIDRRGEWKLAQGVLTARSSAQGRAVLSLPLWMPKDFELTGILFVQRSAGHPHANVFWGENRGSEQAYVQFCPSRGKVTLYNEKGEGQAVDQIDQQTPLPFGIRVRGGKVAAFFRFGAKPDVSAQTAEAPSRSLLLVCEPLGATAPFEFRRLRIRRLEADVPLDAPIRLPSVGGQGDAPPEQEW